MTEKVLFLKSKRVAEGLGVDNVTIFRHATSGQLGHTKVGRLFQFSFDNLAKFLKDPAEVRRRFPELIDDQKESE